MIEIKGKYNSAKIYADYIEESCMKHIYEILNQSFIEGSHIAIMPDTHEGKGSVVGCTMTITDKVVPNIVGVDISCGLLTIPIHNKIDLSKLDDFINNYVPSGYESSDKRVNLKDYGLNSDNFINDLRCANSMDYDKSMKQLGSLGGGNHFIEIDIDDDGTQYLIVHTGSRNLGLKVCNYYQNKAYKNLSSINDDRMNIVNKLKSEGRQSEIQSELVKFNSNHKINSDYAYCEGKLFDDYIHDMRIMNKYAMYNRIIIVSNILNKFLKSKYSVKKYIDKYAIHTVHNYVDTDSMIVRKGAVSARLGETLVIPINMRDGSLICTGKSNADYNYSAPHGAGRCMSRSKANKEVSLDNFKESMKGIYTTSVNNSTIDESPFAYKSLDDIVSNIYDTVDIIKHIKPIYNFKAHEID